MSAKALLESVLWRREKILRRGTEIVISIIAFSIDLYFFLAIFILF